MIFSELSVYPHDARHNMCQFVPTQASRVVDVGCNTGAFGETLKTDRPIEVWGVEPNPIAAEKAGCFLDKVVNSFFDSNVELPDAGFDAVIFNDVLEHLADPWEALRVAARKLRPGGCVVAAIPNLRQIDNIAHILLERDFRYESRGIRDKTHLRFFTRKSIIRLFKESGYRIERLEGINETWWSPSLFRRLSFRILAKYLEDTKYAQFAVVAYPISTATGTDAPTHVPVPS